MVMDTSKFVFSSPVAITDPQSHADALKIISSGAEVDAIAREEFDAKYRGDYELQACSPEKGLILINGNRQAAMVWQDSSFPGDPSMMIAVIFDLKPEGNAIIPTVNSVVAGEDFQGVLKFRRDREGCCPKTKSAMSALVMLEHQGSIKWAERHTVYTRDTCKNLFGNAPGGVVRNNNAMAAIYGQVQAYKPSPSARLTAPILAVS